MRKTLYYLLPFAVIPVLMLMFELLDDTVLRMNPTLITASLCLLCSEYGYHTPKKKLDLIATIIVPLTFFICMFILGLFAENDLGSRFNPERAIRIATQPIALIIYVIIALVIFLTSLVRGFMKSSYNKELTLRPLSQTDDLSNIRELYNEAFPECERKPFEIMTAAIGRGLDMLAIEYGDFVGLAIVLTHGNVALLDYFAVVPHRRGLGIGEDALELLKQKYRGKTLLIEIEDPDGECENREIRIRRLGFYNRCGMTRMPYKVNFYGTEMLVLTSGAPATYEEHIAVYKSVLGDEVAQNITLIDR